MYCVNCGEKINNNNNNFCTKCGINLKSSNSKQENSLKIISIILGCLGIFMNLTFIFSFLGLILSIIGLLIGIFAFRKDKNFIGIILNSIGLFFSIIFIIISIFIFRLIFSSPEEFVEEINTDYYEIFDDVLDTY